MPDNISSVTEPGAAAICVDVLAGDAGTLRFELELNLLNKLDLLDDLLGAGS